MTSNAPQAEAVTSNAPQAEAVTMEPTPRKLTMKSHSFHTPPPTRGYSFDSAWRIDGQASDASASPGQEAIPLGFLPGNPKCPVPKKGEAEESEVSERLSEAHCSADDSPGSKRLPFPVTSVASTSTMSKFDKYYYRPGS